MPKKLEKNELLSLQSWRTAGGFRGAAAGGARDVGVRAADRACAQRAADGPRAAHVRKLSMWLSWLSGVSFQRSRAPRVVEGP
eukprot:270530-Prymnesium_polylepis.1